MSGSNVSLALDDGISTKNGIDEWYDNTIEGMAKGKLGIEQKQRNDQIRSSAASIRFMLDAITLRYMKYTMYSKILGIGRHYVLEFIGPGHDPADKTAFSAKDEIDRWYEDSIDGIARSAAVIIGKEDITAFALETESCAFGADCYKGAITALNAQKEAMYETILGLKLGHKDVFDANQVIFRYLKH